MRHDDEEWLVPWHRRGIPTEQARLIRAELLAYKARLRRVAHGAGETSRLKRFAESKMRKRRNRLLDLWPVRWPREIVTIRHPPAEPILDTLNPKRRTYWKPINERPYKSATLDLKTFSFVDDPVHTISLLKKISELEGLLSEGQLNFDDQQCLDIGPYLVLQAMRQGMLPIFVGGRISHSVQRVIEFVGLRNALGMRFPKTPSPAGIWPLPFRNRSPQGNSPQRLLRDQTSEYVASEVIDGINRWLRRLADLELTSSGERLVLSMTGEALDNAERHSNPNSADGSWSVAGFMAQQKDGEEISYRCHLALLCTGVSIAESMETAGTVTKAKMEEYVRKHTGILKSAFARENLQTVFALQDGVSRVHDALVSGRGGTGLMDIVEFFGALSGTSKPVSSPPCLAIVSGSTCITLKPPYMQGIRRRTATHEGLLSPRELWFNASNSPDEAPDPEFVLSLPAHLKGTLITMAWTTDAEFLRSKANVTS